MNTHDLKPLTLPTQNKEIISSIVYALERILTNPQGFSYDSEENAVYVSTADFEQAKNFLNRYDQRRMKFFDRLTPAKSIYQSEHPPLKISAPKDTIDVQKIDAGVYGLFNDYSLLLSELDRFFASRLKNEFQLINTTLPLLIPEEHLRRASYLDRESHQIAWVNTQTQKDGDAGRCCLSPAHCLSLYPLLENSTLESPSFFTSFGVVHRYEGGRFSDQLPLTRLREFHSREIIGFGPEPTWIAFRDRLIHLLVSIAEHFELPIVLQYATDMFFHPENISMAFDQIQRQSKLELRVLFEGSDPLACASINLHSDHFIKAFQIKLNCSEPMSYCCGFGLERWAHVLAQKFGSAHNALLAVRKFNL